MCVCWCVQEAKREVELCRTMREEAMAARKEAETALRNAKKEIEAHELVRCLTKQIVPISLTHTHARTHTH